KHIEQPRPGAWPVCVRAGAFGDGQPVRDLRLSPGHAVCVDVLGEIFTPVSGLINGVTILAEPVAEVTYWHVELESHDVLLAEGLPCESYMDAGNRAFFGRQYGRLQAVDPERVSESLTRYARPFVNDEATVAALRRRLEARARRLFDCRLNRTAVSMLRRFGA
ncbi:MAG: Hint domain-containing protein, partial [Caulobacteraceae bacterium]